MFNINYALALYKSHTFNYSVPNNVSYAWNVAFILTCAYILQLISGWLLATVFIIAPEDMMHRGLLEPDASVDSNITRRTHTTFVTAVFIGLTMHIIRTLLYTTLSNYTYNFGIIIYLMCVGIAFMGYVLPWGNMSYWGATVITSLLELIPNATTFLLGASTSSLITVQRFLVLHYALPFIAFILVIIHLGYLHARGSVTVHRYSTNLRTAFVPYVITQDMCLLLFVMTASVFTVLFTPLSLVHPDNSTLANALVTPTHIVPEWYFLAVYSVIKSVPHKIAGFLLVLSFYITTLRLRL